MLDTLSLAREMKDAGVAPRQAAISRVVQRAVEHGDPATRADLDAHRAALQTNFDAHRAAVGADSDALRAKVRADLTALETRLPIEWMSGVAHTTAGIVAAGTAVVVAAFRALG